MKTAWIVVIASAALLALAAPSPAAAAAPGGGQPFLEHAIQGDTAMMKIGKLAEKKGTTARVREFGRLLRSDHLRARKMATALAKKMGAPVPATPSAQGRQTYDALSKLSGRRFDRKFVADMVTDHQKDIAAYAAETHSGDKPVAKLAKRTLPKLEDHLKVAYRLQVRLAPIVASR